MLYFYTFAYCFHAQVFKLSQVNNPALSNKRRKKKKPSQRVMFGILNKGYKMGLTREMVLIHLSRILPLRKAEWDISPFTV